MDREGKRGIKSLFNKIASREMIGAEHQEKMLMYNVIGFIPITNMVDNSLLISNLAVELSTKNMNICVVDFNVFYPSLYHRLDAEVNGKGKGLYACIRNDKGELKEHLNQTKYNNLYLLSPSPQDLFEEYFEFRLEQIERIMLELKETFDIVLIDIPNNPAFEFCIGALQSIHIGFMTCFETVEAGTNALKLLSFTKSIGISTAKLSNIIVMNALNLGFDYKGIEDIGLNIVTSFPFVKGTYHNALNNQVYVSNASGYNKHFIKALRSLANQIAEE